MAELKDIKDRRPNPGLVSILEDLLERAKSGEVRTAAYVVGYDDDSTSQGWAMDGRTSHRRILGELTLLTHEYTTNIGLRDGDSVLSQALND